MIGSYLAAARRAADSLEHARTASCHFCCLSSTEKRSTTISKELIYRLSPLSGVIQCGVHHLTFPEPRTVDIFIALQVAQLARSKTNPLRSFEQMSNLFRLCQATPLLSLRSQVPDAAIESKPSNAWRVAFLPIQRWPQKKLDSLNCSLE